ITLLPRRNPGSSGITGPPAQPGVEDQPSTRWEEESTQDVPAPQPVSGTSSFFAARGRITPPDDEPSAPAEVPSDSAQAPQTDLIYQRMLSEWLVDPHELARSPDLDWKSVWDSGWSAAAEADNVPVAAHTDHGLPVREPGARLVPGAATPDNGDDGLAPNGGLSPGDTGRSPAHEAPPRDPDAIRASISSHFSGVRAGRSHARETPQGPDHE
ncbi:MAG: ATP-binding protein, partial [Mycobacterium sp.]